MFLNSAKNDHIESIKKTKKVRLKSNFMQPDLVYFNKVELDTIKIKYIRLQFST